MACRRSKDGSSRGGGVCNDILATLTRPKGARRRTAVSTHRRAKRNGAFFLAAAFMGGIAAMSYVHLSSGGGEI